MYVCVCVCAVSQLCVSLTRCMQRVDMEATLGEVAQWFGQLRAIDTLLGNDDSVATGVRGEENRLRRDEPQSDEDEDRRRRLDAMREAFLSRRTADPAFLKNMEEWSDDRNLKISRDDLKAYKKLASDLEDSLKKGRAAFESTNKRASL